jgi:polysaccharide pyruvyl transferase CsaB
MAEYEYTVGISGSYGGLNLGDEAILQSMVRQLQDSLPVRITVFSRNPEDTRKRHRVERVVGVRDLTRGEVCRELQELDLFILGGGGILFDAEAETFLREVTIAQELGVPVMVYAVSAGPLEKSSSRRIVREALDRAAVITVRDRGSKKILEEAGVEKEIVVTADPALLLAPEPLPEDALLRESMESGKRIVGMSVREPGPAFSDVDEKVYHRLLADTADFIIDRYDAQVLFVPMERRMLDMQHSHAIIARMLRPQRAGVLKGEFTSGQLLTLMREFDFAVGMRLHFLIFAALQEVPFIGLPYASKVEQFLADLHLTSPPLKLVSAGRLIAHLDHSWDARQSILERISEHLPGLKERAGENNRILEDLLRSIVKAKDRPVAAECPAG